MTGPSSEIDVHGLRRADAREALSAFVRDAYRQGLHCVRVVHGKRLAGLPPLQHVHEWLHCVRVVHGKRLGSPGKIPVLKGKVQSWLIQKDEVLAFVQARACDGGAGALVALLRPWSPV